MQHILCSKTPPQWLPQACDQFDAVLVDHAHCEKKAAASAMALVSAYPQRSALVRRCSSLAQEELRHFRQVHRLILRRGLVFGRDPGDPYARALLAEVRKTPHDRLIDRLLVCALIEARSCERLALLGEGLPDAELRDFYRDLAAAEAGHQMLFVRLALAEGPAAEVHARLQDLAAREAEVVASLPVEPRIH